MAVLVSLLLDKSILCGSTRIRLYYPSQFVSDSSGLPLVHASLTIRCTSHLFVTNPTLRVSSYHIYSDLINLIASSPFRLHNTQHVCSLRLVPSGPPKSCLVASDNSSQLTSSSDWSSLFSSSSGLVASDYPFSLPLRTDFSAQVPVTSVLFRLFSTRRVHTFHC